MDIKIKPGRAWINGYYYHLQDAPKVMTLRPANLTQGRIDRVSPAAQPGGSYRHISVEVKTGQRADVPAAPELERTAAIWELGLADIRINPGVTECWSNVTDLRLDDTMWFSNQRCRASRPDKVFLTSFKITTTNARAV